MKQHPIIDTDGHHLEFLPALDRFLEKYMGSKHFNSWLSKQKATSSSQESLSFTRKAKPGWWSGPPSHALIDRAAASFPKLLANRLPEIGIDFMIIYTSVGLTTFFEPDAAIRKSFFRGLNSFYAEYFMDYPQRLTPAGVIPMFTPEEALAEIEFCYQLGFKALQLSPGVPRPIPSVHEIAPSLYPSVYWLDSFGIDSLHNYDPVWQKLSDLQISATFHSHSATATSAKHSRSISNYMFNHFGAHGSLMFEICKSILLGGICNRFPKLNFAFLEGGVLWACGLLNDLCEHWKKRNIKQIGQYDPRKIDTDQLKQLGDKWGYPLVSSPKDIENGFYANRRESKMGDWSEPRQLDDFWRMNISDIDELSLQFENLFFGCEGDDNTIRMAFDGKNDINIKLQAMFSTDYGHWDADNPAGLAESSKKLIHEGIVTPQDYKLFACDNVIKLHGRNNPNFWQGTSVERYASEILTNG